MASYPKNKKVKRFEVYEDILSIYLNFYYANQKQSNLFRGFRGSVVKKLWQSLLHFFSLVAKFFLFGLKGDDINSKRLWAFVLSSNNYIALKFLREYWTNKDLAYVVLDGKEIGDESDISHINTYRRFVYFHLFLSLWMKFYLKYKSFAVEYFNVIFYSIGYYEVLTKVLKRNRPRAIIFSNDHNIDARALLLAAKNLSIKTIYIQHAAVSIYFPRLIFDLSLLEGEVSTSRYEACGKIEGVVKLIGMPKFDQYLQYRRKKIKKIVNIGVTLNYSDNWATIFELIDELMEKFPQKKVTMRPHPLLADVIEPRNGVKYSHSVKENSFDFLIKQDVIIAANSSILLEATMINIGGIYFNSGGQQFDYYGFVENELVEKASSIDEVVELINTMVVDDKHFMKAKPYNQLIGTSQEGHSHTLATKYISELL